MKYLVTGGAGFIGSHIVRTLLEQGKSVRVLDNFSTGKRENLEGLSRQFSGDRFEVMEGDLRDAARVEEAVRGVEVIFHEAAFVSVPQSMQEPQTCFDVNITGTSRLLDAARAAGVRRVVLASSAAVYGESDAFPLVEETSPQPLISLRGIQACEGNVRGVVHGFIWLGSGCPALFQRLWSAPTTRLNVRRGGADLCRAGFWMASP